MQVSDFQKSTAGFLNRYVQNGVDSRLLYNLRKYLTFEREANVQVRRTNY